MYKVGERILSYLHARLSTDPVSEAAPREKDSTALRRGLALAECSSHKGSSQRMPYQPSAPRLLATQKSPVALSTEV
uniref:Uncharacterized protein n=1 Tax=Theropithecus gelada TaxID=9565 RepID=A0A8D2ESV5_THEGE